MHNAVQWRIVMQVVNSSTVRVALRYAEQSAGIGEEG